jgi:glycosyltransferase involved in cell wall biosynthesis
MTSEREGLSVITLESIALGTPVVVPKGAVLPAEVRELCVVRDDASLPDTILEMLSSNDKGSFIPNRKRIENFYATRTVQFYTYLFDRLGLDGRNPGPKS